jgi:hypothetical protein
MMCPFYPGTDRMFSAPSSPLYLRVVFADEAGCKDLHRRLMLTLRPGHRR